MAACAHPELFNDEDEGGMKYIEFNCNFKMDCSILLEKVTWYVGTKVKQDFNSIDYYQCHTKDWSVAVEEVRQAQC